MGKTIKISGKKFGELRHRLKMSQERFAERWGKTSGRVRAIEGKEVASIYLNSFADLAKKLEMTPEELLDALAPDEQRRVSVEIPASEFGLLQRLAKSVGLTVAEWIVNSATEQAAAGESMVRTGKSVLQLDEDQRTARRRGGRPKPPIQPERSDAPGDAQKATAKS